ncbi:hypothetical protein Dda_5872 [Drechslerella dactyloides]|uniref:Uncharacterized protein n=1 Tax=Drechslerella dactyloides TaxID=74499 RepID=A0AAD6IV80_DREDA|nr:hypothetical protein Dda_5872 [Drechslerella dactyloides]
MSTPQPTPAATPADDTQSRRRSIQRFLSKIIKPGKSGKSKKPEPASADPTASAAESSSAAAEAPSTSATPATPATPAPPVTPAPPAPEPIEDVAEPTEAGPSTSKAAPLSVGARLLAEKHGIEIPEDWPYPARPPIGERVEKPIRMRVRRYCHICQTAFGSDKACPSCSHKRCVECPRSPASKQKKKQKHKEKEPEPYEGLSIPAKPAGQDLVYRKIKQRVHYKCHKCETDFAGQRHCPSCNHNCCKRCQRTPSRKPKEELPKRKRPIKWKCSECHTGGNVAKTCSKCSHPRCVDCTRELKKKKKKAVMPVEATGTDTDVDIMSSALAAAKIS